MKILSDELVKTFNISDKGHLIFERRMLVNIQLPTSDNVISKQTSASFQLD